MRTADRRRSDAGAPVSLSDLLFPALYRRKALALLLLNPGRRLHAREIARITQCAPGGMAKELGLLQQAGILDRHTVGNQAQFEANQHHPVFAELAALLRKTVGIADVLVDAMSPLRPLIRVAFIFGSVARGEERTGSDVDLVVIGDVGFSELTTALYPTQAILQREVNSKIYAPGEWAMRLAEGSTFLQEILRKPKIFLLGTEDELEQLGQSPEPETDRPA